MRRKSHGKKTQEGELVWALRGEQRLRLLWRGKGGRNKEKKKLRSSTLGALSPVGLRRAFGGPFVEKQKQIKTNRQFMMNKPGKDKQTQTGRQTHTHTHTHTPQLTHTHTHHTTHRKLS